MALHTPLHTLLFVLILRRMWHGHRLRGHWTPASLSPVILTVFILSLAFATPRDVAFSRLLPAAPVLAASMWPVLPTVALRTACLLIMIGVGLEFTDVGTQYTSAAIFAVTAAAAWASRKRLQRETEFNVRLIADTTQQLPLRPLPSAPEASKSTPSTWQRKPRNRSAARSHVRQR